MSFVADKSREILNKALGKMEKMRIEIRKEPDPTKEAEKIIYVQFNPSSYTTTKNLSYCDGQPIGSDGSSLSFNKIEAQEVSFDFMFDASGIAAPMKIVSKNSDFSSQNRLYDTLNPIDIAEDLSASRIDEDLNKFIELLSGYQGDEHQPRYLSLIWGNLHLNCRLLSINIEHKLFRKDGTVIRAIAKCKFKEYKPQILNNAMRNKQSSDITHIQTYTGGERLCYMAEKIYRSNDFFVQLAEANKLMSFRQLPPNTRIEFPPTK